VGRTPWSAADAPVGFPSTDREKICDPLRVRFFGASAKLTLATITVTAGCAACTLFYPTVPVARNFRVKLQDRGRPVIGVRAEISGSQSGAGWAGAVTDQNGFALFRDVPSGTFHLNADHDAAIADGVNLVVKPNGPAEVTITLKWPSVSPVSVRSLNGENALA
jgi:hypothetical protein